MVFSASGFRSNFRGLSRLAIAGIAAILLGLPSAAGATVLPPPGISPSDFFAGGSFGTRDDRLTLEGFRADFVELALHDLDFGLPGLPPFLDGFGHDFSRETHRRGDGAMFDGVERHRWFGAVFGGRRGPVGDALRLRNFCPIKPPPEVPEPGTAVLLAGGLIALSLARRERRG